MSSETVTFDSERLTRLRKAQALFKSDTGKDISLDDFLDMLIKTFILYREKRGPTESSLLTKLTQT
ncbi:MAG TPA: hypothetical protein VMU35_08930 [Methylomirabilota bacterium]|nr:hypothetical protein [Methylomirabilota bacterium]